MTNSRAFHDYFDRVRIVSLPSRTDRRAETEAEFSRHGWRIDDERVAFFDALAPASADGFDSPGVRGCFLSHLAILESALADQVGKILILEDDIAFIRQIATLGRSAVDQLAQRPWGLAYLGHQLPDLSGSPTWHPVPGPMSLSHFYAVHADALERLVDFLRRVLERPPGHPDGGPMHYDGALSTFIAQNPDVSTIYFSNNLGYQRPSSTDLHTASIMDRHAALAPLRFLYRALKRAYWHATR